MKRIIVALLAALMVFGLASCNDNPNNVGLIIGNQTSSTQKTAQAAKAVADEVSKAIEESGFAPEENPEGEPAGTNITINVGGETFSGKYYIAKFDNNPIPTSSLSAEAVSAYWLKVVARLESSRSEIRIDGLYKVTGSSFSKVYVAAAYNGTQISISETIFDSVVEKAIASMDKAQAVADLGNALNKTAFFGDLLSALQKITYDSILEDGQLPDNIDVTKLTGTSDNGITISMTKYDGKTSVPKADLIKLIGGTTATIPLEFTVKFKDGYNYGMHSAADTTIENNGNIILETTLNVTADETKGSVASINGIDVTINGLSFKVGESSHTLSATKFTLPLGIENIDLKSPTNPANSDKSLFSIEHSDLATAIANFKVPTDKDLTTFTCDDVKVSYSAVLSALDEKTSFEEV